MVTAARPENGHLVHPYGPSVFPLATAECWVGGLLGAAEADYPYLGRDSGALGEDLGAVVDGGVLGDGDPLLAWPPEGK